MWKKKTGKMESLKIRLFGEGGRTILLGVIANIKERLIYGNLLLPILNS